MELRATGADMAPHRDESEKKSTARHLERCGKEQFDDALVVEPRIESAC